MIESLLTMIWKSTVGVIVKESSTKYGNIPLALKKLPDLAPWAKWLVVRYLGWRLGRMSSVDLHDMIDAGYVSTENLDFFIAEHG